MLKRALALDGTDAEVWAAQAKLASDILSFGYDRSSARKAAVRQQAERAVKLDPGSIEAQGRLEGTG